MVCMRAMLPYAALAGLALPVHISTGSGKQRTMFQEDLLFTHRGLSGPAVLQISSYWRPGQALSIDLTHGSDLADALLAAKLTSKRQLGNELAQHLPTRLADAFLAESGLGAQRPMPDCRDRDLQQLAQRLQAWPITPDGDEGWKKAEVMAGGIDTRDLSSQTLASRHVPGLYFIGEAVDVTGWLGGYNFQWAARTLEYHPDSFAAKAAQRWHYSKEYAGTATQSIILVFAAMSPFELVIVGVEIPVRAEPRIAPPATEGITEGSFSS